MLLTVRELKQQPDHLYISFYHLLSTVELSAIKVSDRNPPLPSLEHTFTQTKAVQTLQTRSATKAVHNYQELEFSVATNADAVELLQAYNDARLIRTAVPPKQHEMTVDQLTAEDTALAFTVKALAVVQDVRKGRFFRNSGSANLFYLMVDLSLEKSLSIDQMTLVLARMFASSASSLTGGKSLAAYPATLNIIQESEKSQSVDDYLAKNVQQQVIAGKPQASATTTTQMQQGDVVTDSSGNAGKGEFTGRECIDWLLTYTSATSRLQAHVIAIDLTRCGYLYPVRRHNSSVASFDSMDDPMLILALGASGKKALSMDSAPGEASSKGDLPQGSVDGEHTSASSFGGLAELPNVRRNSRSSIAGRRRSDMVGTDSNALKLKEILEDKELLALFTAFMRKQICEENILFYMDAASFYKKFRDVDCAQDIIQNIEVMFAKYLRPSAPHELNLESRMHKRMKARYDLAMKFLNGDPNHTSLSLEPNVNGESYSPATALRYDFFNVLQKYVFKMMAEESVAKFIKWEEYVKYMEGLRKREEEGLKSATGNASNPNGILEAFRRMLFKTEQPGSPGAQQRGRRMSMQAHRSGAAKGIAPETVSNSGGHLPQSKSYQGPGRA